MIQIVVKVLYKLIWEDPLGVFSKVGRPFIKIKEVYYYLIKP